jgi:hypothetical protein
LVEIDPDSLSDNQKVLENFKQNLKKVQQGHYDIKAKYTDLVGLGSRLIKDAFNFETEEKQQVIILVNDYFNAIGWYPPTLTGAKNKKKRNKQKARKEALIKGLEKP